MSPAPSWSSTAAGRRCEGAPLNKREFNGGSVVTADPMLLDTPTVLHPIGQQRRIWSFARLRGETSDKLALPRLRRARHSRRVDGNRPLTSRRGAALAVALFAITLNFLQPLAHAALFRLGAPEALWSVFCNSAAADPAPSDGSLPRASHDHECCLGLAHATPLVEPSSGFVLLPRVARAAAPLPTLDRPISVGIRDGPGQPRGPPLIS